MRKNRRFLTATLALAVVSGSVLCVSITEAAPQWRQRRWLNRPAIDSTIRDTVAFRQPRYTAARTYSTRPYRGRVSTRGFRIGN